MVTPRTAVVVTLSARTSLDDDDDDDDDDVVDVTSLSALDVVEISKAVVVTSSREREL